MSNRKSMSSNQIFADEYFHISSNKFACKLHFGFDNDIIHGNNSVLR